MSNSKKQTNDNKKANLPKLQSNIPAPSVGNGRQYVEKIAELQAKQSRAISTKEIAEALESDNRTVRRTLQKVRRSTPEHSSGMKAGELTLEKDNPNNPFGESVKLVFSSSKDGAFYTVGVNDDS